MLGTKLVLLFPVVILALAAHIFLFGRARGRDARPPRSRRADCTAEDQQCRIALPAPERGSAPAPCPAVGHRQSGGGGLDLPSPTYCRLNCVAAVLLLQILALRLAATLNAALLLLQILLLQVQR